MHCPLSLPIFKYLLNKPVNIDDLYNYDIDTYKSTLYLLECSASEVEFLGLTFSIDEDHYGELRTTDLIPNGRDIDVTGENRVKYVKVGGLKLFWRVFVTNVWWRHSKTCQNSPKSPTLPSSDS